MTPQPEARGLLHDKRPRRSIVHDEIDLHRHTRNGTSEVEPIYLEVHPVPHQGAILHHAKRITIGVRHSRERRIGQSEHERDARAAVVQNERTRPLAVELLARHRLLCVRLRECDERDDEGQLLESAHGIHPDLGDSRM